MTPQQLIDLCRATNQPLPSGRKIAEVVERLVEENEVLRTTGTAAERQLRRASRINANLTG